eukprot:COSAG02_NODE_2650_length_8327_cov_247.925620_3_plen_900_part_00
MPPEPEPEVDAAAAAAEAAEAAAAAAAAAELAAQKLAEAEASRKLKEQQENMEEIAKLAQSLTGKEKQTYAKQLTSSMDRRLLRQGLLKKQGDVKISPRYFFLFNDMMLFCRFNEGKKGKATTYEPRKALSADQLKDSTLKVLASERDLKDKELAFEMKTPGYDTVLYAATPQDREEWVLELKQVVTNLRDDPAATAYGELHRLVEGTLHHAALVGDVDLAQRCIAPPRDPKLLDQVDDHGATALHVACFSGKDSVAAVLVEAGASAAILDAAGRSAVHLAATGGHVDIISDAFASPSVDLDIADTADTTPLRHALESDNMGVATMLVATGAEPNRANASGWTGLHVAAQAGQADAVRRWISVGADCNISVAEAGGKHDGYTALLLAARAPADMAEATISVLLENGADPNTTEAGGRSALQLAMEVDNTTVAEFLVRRGARYEGFAEELDEGTLGRFGELHQEFLAAEERKRLLAASLAAPKGAQKLARDSVVSGYAFVSGSTKWNRRYLVVTKEEMDMTAQNPDGLLLHRYTLDTDTEPLQSVPLPLETCAIEKVEGRPGAEGEVGVLISGVGSAAKSRAGGGFKAKMGGKLGQAADLLKKGEAGMYRLSFENDDPSVPSREVQQRWVSRMMRCGLGGDIEEAKRIEEEKKWEEAEAARKQEEAEAEEFARQALGVGAGGGAAGGAAGGVGDVFQQVNQAKDTLNDNIQKLGEMADKTEEMRVNAMVRSHKLSPIVHLTSVAFHAARLTRCHCRCCWVPAHGPWVYAYNRISATWRGKCERRSRNATNAAGCFNEPQLKWTTAATILSYRLLLHAPTPLSIRTGQVRSCMSCQELPRASRQSPTSSRLLRHEIRVDKISRYRGLCCCLGFSCGSCGRRRLTGEVRMHKIARQRWCTAV